MRRAAGGALAYPRTRRRGRVSLNREINVGLVNPTIKARLGEVATTPKIFTPAEFGAHVAAEIEKWRRVIKFAGIRAE
jgi:tripartite-type tricarboxylate transporter receptor subunit TctC